MPHAREQDSDALHVEGQGCGLGSQTALSAKSIVGRKMRLRAGTSALFRRRPLEISPLGRRHHGAQCRARALGAPEEADTPLAALGELGATVGDDGLTQTFLAQALSARRAFTG